MRTILFACVHNAGRSQMAAAFARLFGGETLDVLSGGSEPGRAVNPTVIEAMREVGIDISENAPRRFDDSDVQQADVVITMGCGDECPFYPGRRYEDWEIADPKGKSLEEVRAIRDEIQERVKALVAELSLATDSSD